MRAIDRFPRTVMRAIAVLTRMAMRAIGLLTRTAVRAIGDRNQAIHGGVALVSICCALDEPHFATPLKRCFHGPFSQSAFLREPLDSRPRVSAVLVIGERLQCQ